MSKISAAKTFTAILSVATLGAAISFGAGTALAPGQERHRGSDRPRAGAGKEAADPRPFGRPADQSSIRPQPPPKASSCRRSAAAPRVRCRSAEREEIATIVKDKPKIDLEINFDYNSADISAKSLPSVQALGRALTNADLKGSTFVVAGHTDAAGGEAYNQDLSERRADCDQALSRRQIRHQRHRSRHRRIRQEQAQGSEPADGGSEPPRPGREHGKQGHGVERSQIRPLQVRAWRRPIVSGYNTSRSTRAGRIRFGLHFRSSADQMRPV